MKNYNGMLSASKFNRLQLGTYAEALKDQADELRYFVKNGRVSQPFKDLVKDLNDMLNEFHGTTNKAYIKLLDGLGNPIV